MAHTTEENAVRCELRIKGEHFYSDADMYLNFYGVEFFISSEDISFRNPFLPKALSNLPGIVDEFLEPCDTPASAHQIPSSKTQAMITKTVNPAYIDKKNARESYRPASLDISCTGTLEEDEYGNIKLSYGDFIPNTLFIRDGIISAEFAFSPLCCASFQERKRVSHLGSYPLSKKGLLTDEEIGIDYNITAGSAKHVLTDDGINIFLEYEMEIYGTICEKSKIGIYVKILK